MSWLAAAGDLLLGATCPCCRRPWWGLCPDCRAMLRSRVGQLTRPSPCPEGFPPTATTGPYDQAMRRLIIAHKERSALGLAPMLGELLAVACWFLIRDRAGTDRRRTRVVLVPVPSSPGAIRRRGYDATTTLARCAAGRLRPALPVAVRRLLVQSRRVQDQSGLDAAARRQNLADSLRVRAASGLVGGTGKVAVIIVDDLVTTGASLTEAHRALTDGGVRVLGAATIAATRKMPVD